MVLTVFDPRAGTQVRIWFPAVPTVARPVPATVIRHPRFARAATRTP
ncbi:hypothetical protein [Methylobacterium oxalidis]|uniref:Uncharacterized protein n=1 Tax=Methylobacterium oxalidis TaxID=944322 RepID=A0A512J113_9HYPH|nr:hypothetical protein [Methylobacterium oxalidis]GEP03625.1 hypothetical protein MOX02_16630 [Methylobacterium oxalidis]GJE34332.1 hypothetical protein LDDCCGHA_4543 [Methylobacterium oxalidis]GLS64952.1 hypothetical protein GCM10007888_33330 [Methylobacterium oxalidis]